MKLENSFRVQAPIGEAFALLRDIERIAPCMPGASLEEVDGDEFTGQVTVKLGPMQIAYKGKARFVEVDEAAYRTVIEATGRETRGSGTVGATITSALREVDGATQVDVTTDLNITGRPAQFGRGVMVEVGNRLMTQFADCLALQLSTPDAAPDAMAEDAVADPAAAGGDAGAMADAAGPESSPVAPAASTPPVDARPAAAKPAAAQPASAAQVDLIKVALGPALKRIVPLVVAVGVVVWLVVRFL